MTVQEYKEPLNFIEASDNTVCGANPAQKALLHLIDKIKIADRVTPGGS